MKLKKIFHRLIKNNKGSAIIFPALAMTVIVGFAALVTDVGLLYFNRTKLSNAADAAALAGASELLNNVNNVETVARDYAVNRNGLNSDEIKNVEIFDNATSVRVTTGRKVHFAFARVLGLDSSMVRASSAAKTAPVSSAKDIVPLTVPDDAYENYEEGEKVTLKVGDWEEGEIGEGNFNALALGDSQGANYFRDLVKYGFNEFVSIGDEVDTEPGNMSGPTEQGVNYRIDLEAPDKPIITIPLFENDPDQEGRTSVTIVGFASFQVDEVVGSGNNSKVKGEFVRRIEPASKTSDGSAEDFGAYGLKLIE